MARYHTPDNRKPNAGALELVTVVEALKRCKKSIACRFDIETCAIVANIKDFLPFCSSEPISMCAMSCFCVNFIAFEMRLARRIV